MGRDRLGDELLPWAILPMLFVAAGTLFLYKGVLEANSTAPQLSFHSTGPANAWLAAAMALSAFVWITRAWVAERRRDDLTQRPAP